MEDCSGAERTRHNAHEDHVEWLKRQYENYQKHMQEQAPNSHGHSASVSLLNAQYESGYEDEYMPVYRSLGTLAADTDVDPSYAASEEPPCRHSLPCAEEDEAVQAAEQTWLSGMRPPLVRRQRAFERLSI